MSGSGLMIIWFALMIPLATAAVLYWRFHHRVSWQEVLLLVGAPTLLVALSKLMIDTVVASDTEFWGGWATKAEYFEDWNERAALRFGRLKADLEGPGKRIEDYDIAIAAIALSLGARVATMNVRHFARVEGLDIEDWSLAGSSR